MKNKLIRYIKIYGTSLLLASSIVFIGTFFKAYNSESKTVLININSIGEANFEMFFVIPLTIILGILAWWFTIRDESQNITQKTL